MKIARILALSLLVAALAACESGDIVLQPTVNGTGGGGGGGGGGTTNPCASYTTPSGQFFQGSVDANGHCFYNALFVSDTRPITVSDDSVIDVTVAAPHECRFHFDSVSRFDAQPYDSIRMRRSEHVVTLLHPEGYSYFAMLREKLHWSATPRY